MTYTYHRYRMHGGDKPVTVAGETVGAMAAIVATAPGRAPKMLYSVDDGRTMYAPRETAALAMIAAGRGEMA